MRKQWLQLFREPDGGAGSGAPPAAPAAALPAAPAVPAPPAAPAAAAPPAVAPPADPRGTFDGPYDEARATALINNLRSDNANLKTKAGKFDELEQANLSDAEKQANKVTAAEARAEAAEAKLLRSEIAAAKGLTPEQATRLNGSTAEELNADADALLALFGQQPPATPVPGGAAQVTPVLQATGAGQELPEETDPAKLAAEIPRF